MTAAIAPLRAAAPHLSWTAEEKLHLTLKFLGERPEAAVERIGAAMDDVGRRHRPFTMRLRQVGAFPHFRRARVIWIGVEPTTQLEFLHHDVEVACEGLGIPLEGRAFRPHVTVARVRERQEDDVMRPVARAARAVTFEREVPVASVDLMRSSPGARAYERLHASPLSRERA